MEYTVHGHTVYHKQENKCDLGELVTARHRAMTVWGSWLNWISEAGNFGTVSAL